MSEPCNECGHAKSTHTSNPNGLTGDDGVKGYCFPVYIIAGISCGCSGYVAKSANPDLESQDEQDKQQNA